MRLPPVEFCTGLIFKTVENTRRTGQRRPRRLHCKLNVLIDTPGSRRPAFRHLVFEAFDFGPVEHLQGLSDTPLSPIDYRAPTPDLILNPPKSPFSKPLPGRWRFYSYLESRSRCVIDASFFFRQGDVRAVS